MLNGKEFRIVPGLNKLFGLARNKTTLNNNLYLESLDYNL
jgi:hypothetical protein